MIVEFWILELSFNNNKSKIGNPRPLRFANPHCYAKRCWRAKRFGQVKSKMLLIW